MKSDKGWAMLSNPSMRALVGWVLGFWSGSINTITLLAVLYEASVHMSGRVRAIGMNAILYPPHALLALVIVTSFTLGGFLAGKCLDRIGFTRSLLFVVGGIGLGALFVWMGFYATSRDDYGLGRMIMAFILPAVLGFQNGLTSMLPQIGRTTHWTGDLTDMGIALAKGNFVLASHNAIKIFGFLCGTAVFGYIMAIRHVPAVQGLVMVVVGYFITVVIFHRMNQALANAIAQDHIKPDGKNIHISQKFNLERDANTASKRKHST